MKSVEATLRKQLRLVQHVVRQIKSAYPPLQIATLKPISGTIASHCTHLVETCNRYVADVLKAKPSIK
jgi:hypothetical protein